MALILNGDFFYNSELTLQLYGKKEHDFFKSNRSAAGKERNDIHRMDDESRTRTTCLEGKSSAINIHPCLS